MLDLPVPSLIGVVHLSALPGSPLATLDMNEIVGRALADARNLKEAGFDAAIVENFGDAPYTASKIGPASTAAMAVVAQAIRLETGLVIGINALRNDAGAALGIAAAAQACFVRVNVHTGVYATDQGIISGRAGKSLRYRKLLNRRIAIFADVHVKHATPLGQPDIDQAARETAYRGLADALIVTGSATGGAVDPDDLVKVRNAVPDRRLFIGSGATSETIAQLLPLSDGVIVGTGIKQCGQTGNPIDAHLARAFVKAARP